MPAKKTPTKKPRGKKPVGLTSAIGAKATTILVICVMAGGMAVAARMDRDLLLAGLGRLLADVERLLSVGRGAPWGFHRKSQQTKHEPIEVGPSERSSIEVSKVGAAAQTSAGDWCESRAEKSVSPAEAGHPFCCPSVVRPRG